MLQNIHTCIHNYTQHIYIGLHIVITFIIIIIITTIVTISVHIPQMAALYHTHHHIHTERLMPAHCF